MALVQQRSERMRPLPTTVAVLALLAIILALTLALASRAEAFVYWSDASTSTIGRASLDGTGVEPSFLTGVGSPSGLAVAKYIYWTDPVGGGTYPNRYGTIGRATLDGTGGNASFITHLGAVTGVAVDGAHIYWSQFRGEGSSDPTLTTIGRANLDGTGVDVDFISGAGYPSSLAVDAAHIYWTDNVNGTIGRANLDGTGTEPNFITGLRPTGVAVDASHIYWSRWIPGPVLTGGIGRANLDGSGVEESFITGLHSPAGIAVGGPVDFSLGKLKKNKKKGTATLTADVPAPGALTVAQTKKLKGTEVRAEAAGEVQLPIKPRGKAKKKLAEKGRARVKAEVTYTPDGGEPESQIATLKLIKRG